MKAHRLLFTACLSVLSYFTSVHASTIELTKSKLEKLVETKQVIAQTRSDWGVEKEYLQHSISLLERELADIDKQIVDLEDGATLADSQRLELQKEQQAYKKSSEVLAERLVGLERDVLALAKRYPDPLKNKIKPLMKGIPTDPNDTKLSLGQRMQNVLGILAQAEKFNQAKTFVGEIRELGGKSVQVNTLYWGLAFAVFVDNTGTLAGVATPGPDGWVWEERNELAPTISRFIEVYEGVTDGGSLLVPVPVALKN